MTGEWPAPLHVSISRTDPDPTQTPFLSFPFHLTNLGQGSDGITAAELSERVFRVIVEETVKQVAESSIGKSISDVTKKIPGAATQQVDKVTRGLGDLLKKK